jgi:hypothetical protein
MALRDRGLSTIPVMRHSCRESIQLSPWKRAPAIRRVRLPPASSSANADGLQWSMVLFKCLYGLFQFLYMASRTIQRDIR